MLHSYLSSQFQSLSSSSLSNRINQRIFRKNKVRTNLIILAHQDLKETKKTSKTKINCKTLTEFEKEFNGAIVSLKEEKYVSIGEFKEERNNRKSKDLCELWLGGITHVNSSSTDKASRASIEKLKRGKDLCFAERKCSISQKKMQHFNNGVLKRHIEEIDDEYEQLREYKVKMEKEAIDKSPMERVIKRKFSKMRIREKLLSNEKKECHKFELAGQGFDYLQTVCASLKMEEIESCLIPNMKQVRYSKSCDKKEIKVLSDLMKNLTDSKNKSSVTMNFVFNKGLRDSIAENKNQNYIYKACEFRKGIHSSVTNCNLLELEEESKNVYVNKNSINYSKFKSINANTAASTSTTLGEHMASQSDHPNPINSVSALNLSSSNEREFRINVLRCSIISSNSSSITEAESRLTPRSDFKDFAITLKNCRKSCDDLEKKSHSRKLSELTPPSSVTDDMV